MVIAPRTVGRHFSLSGLHVRAQPLLFPLHPSQTMSILKSINVPFRPQPTICAELKCFVMRFNIIVGKKRSKHQQTDMWTETSLTYFPTYLRTDCGKGKGKVREKERRQRTGAVESEEAVEELLASRSATATWSWRLYPLCYQ